jgi:hypothetical protein
MTPEDTDMCHSKKYEAGTSAHQARSATPCLRLPTAYFWAAAGVGNDVVESDSEGRLKGAVDREGHSYVHHVAGQASCHSTPKALLLPNRIVDVICFNV